MRGVADPRFHPGAAYIPWLAGGTCFYGIASLASTSALLAKEFRPVMVCWIAGAGLSLGMNFLLVPRFGPQAAAWTYCLVNAVVAGGILYQAQVRLPLQIGWWRLIMGGTLAVALGRWIATPWVRQPWASLGLKLGILAGLGAMMLGLLYWRNRTQAPGVGG